MKKFLLQFFTWWNGETLGTRFHTWRHGKSVGEDEAGNVYYEGGTDSEGRTRRWVIYNGYPKPRRSRPAGTAGCITASTRRRRREDYKPREWQKPHQPQSDRHAWRLPPQGLGPDQREAAAA